MAIQIASGRPTDMHIAAEEAGERFRPPGSRVSSFHRHPQSALSYRAAAALNEEAWFGAPAPT